MILAPTILIRLLLLCLLSGLVQVAFFAKITVLGASPDVALLVVASLGLLGGSVSGAVAGFSIGLLIDVLLLQTLGAFSLALLAVGYVAGRYREGFGRPGRGTVALLGAGLTLLGVTAFAAIQIGLGIDADVSPLVIRDALVKTALGGLLALPVFMGVRLLLRPAVIEEPRPERRPVAPRPLSEEG